LIRGVHTAAGFTLGSCVACVACVACVGYAAPARGRPARAPVVLLYQAWTYHVFRGRMRGPRVDDGEPGPVIPAPRREQVSAGGAPADHLTEDAGSSAPPAGETGSGVRGGHRASARPVLRLATGGFALLLAWLLLRLVLVSRATH
jgi:hypothetical protein